MLALPRSHSGNTSRFWYGRFLFHKVLPRKDAIGDSRNWYIRETIPILESLLPVPPRASCQAFIPSSRPRP
jgi:hypothetical protein